MADLNLDLDDLNVESFDASPDEGNERGTVRGHAVSDYGCGYDSFDCDRGPDYSVDTCDGCGAQTNYCEQSAYLHCTRLINCGGTDYARQCDINV
jgi:hypothetical protein